MPNYDDFDLDLQTSKVGGGDITDSNTGIIKETITWFTADIVKSVIKSAKSFVKTVTNPVSDHTCRSVDYCPSNGCDFVTNSVKNPNL